ncbi:hypothetical protein GFL15_01350 [Rhizobium leguminosarum bv. viciae]|nr:hypothetical protein [Rhizobium leguminosarum bv. viciae]
MRENPSLVGLAAIAGIFIQVLGLDPRDVTGNQPQRVGAANDSCNAEAFLAPKDLGALDSCDRHRNEGVPIEPSLQERRPR